MLSLGGKPDKVIDGLTGDQRFFLAFAQSWRQTEREAALRQQIQTDGHAPDEYRGDTVRNLDAWYAAFGVKPGDKLYLDPARPGPGFGKTAKPRSDPGLFCCWRRERAGEGLALNSLARVTTLRPIQPMGAGEVGTVVDIKNRGQLDKWLKDKPPIWAKVLAARSATRVFPLISSDRGQTDLTLSVGRTLLISWAACKWPTSEMRTANASAHAAANVTATAYASTAAATAAADYVARAAAAAAGGNVANVCIAASSAADAYARATADDAWQAAHDVWCAIEADIRQLEVEKSPETDELALLLLREPLWLLPLSEFV
ncbi:MAG: M13-type metalloendopeptidase [Asticcacaulis sp.]